jgi:hypothetical protein
MTSQAVHAARTPSRLGRGRDSRMRKNAEVVTDFAITDRLLGPPNRYNEDYSRLREMLSKGRGHSSRERHAHLAVSKPDSGKCEVHRTEAPTLLARLRGQIEPLALMDTPNCSKSLPTNHPATGLQRCRPAWAKIATTRYAQRSQHPAVTVRPTHAPRSTALESLQRPSKAQRATR